MNTAAAAAESTAGSSHQAHTGAAQVGLAATHPGPSPTATPSHATSNNSSGGATNRTSDSTAAAVMSGGNNHGTSIVFVKPGTPTPAAAWPDTNPPSPTLVARPAGSVGGGPHSPATSAGGAHTPVTPGGDRASFDPTKSAARRELMEAAAAALDLPHHQDRLSAPTPASPKMAGAGSTGGAGGPAVHPGALFSPMSPGGAAHHMPTPPPRARTPTNGGTGAMTPPRATSDSDGEDSTSSPIDPHVRRSPLAAGAGGRRVVAKPPSTSGTATPLAPRPSGGSVTSGQGTPSHTPTSPAPRPSAGGH
jgi:hypothetical protein